MGIKQILPDQELNLFVLKISAKVFDHFCNEICLIVQSILIISQGFLTFFFCLFSGFHLSLHLSLLP